MQLFASALQQTLQDLSADLDGSDHLRPYVETNDAGVLRGIGGRESISAQSLGLGIVCGSSHKPFHASDSPTRLLFPVGPRASPNDNLAVTSVVHHARQQLRAITIHQRHRTFVP